jgi:cytochrome bd-I ubiquinol oxidase subunit X
MWYFSWMLGLGLALTFSVLNAMWYELGALQREGREAESGEPVSRGPSDSATRPDREVR